MIRALLLLPLLGCGPPDVCVTPCGMVAAECAALIRAEANVLRAYLPIVPPGFVCRALAGSHLYIAPDSADGTFKTPSGVNVYGYVTSGSHEMFLADVPFAQSAYPHEVGHLITIAEGTLDLSDPHSGWEARGFYPAMRRFRAYEFLERGVK